MLARWGSHTKENAGTPACLPTARLVSEAIPHRPAPGNPPVVTTQTSAKESS